MNARTFRSLLVGAGAIICCLEIGPATADQLYRITHLGTLGGQESFARALNASGQVTGTLSTDDEQDGFVPFLWDGHTMRRLGTEVDAFPLGFATGVAINDGGQVTGFFQDEGEGGAPGEESFPFRSDGTTVQNLGTLGGFRAAGRAINSSGRVAGFSTMVNFQRRAFFWNGSTMKNLGTFGGTESDANDVNDAGQVTGSATITGNTETHAFLWNGTTLRDLGTLGGEGSDGVAINSSGQVAGTSVTAFASFHHAFFWNGIKMIDLGTVGGDESFAAAINSAGHVTGSAQPASGRMHAFLWDGSSMLDLGTPVAGTESNGRAINDLGQVTGEFFPAGDGNFHAFIWNGSTMRDLNAVVDPSDPLKSNVKLNRGVDINKRGQIAAVGRDSRINREHAYLVTPLEYQIVFIEPAKNSTWKLGTTVRIKVALAKANGQRISDARAGTLVAAPCKVKVSASGAQTRSSVCMKDDAMTNEFYLNWKLGTTGIGTTAIKVAATYKFSMPETITTTKSRTISIIQ